MKNYTEECIAASPVKANEAWKIALKRHNYERLGIRPMKCKLPSTIQLAQLSAALDRKREEAPMNLASRALEIWGACAERLELQREAEPMYAAEEEKRRKSRIELPKFAASLTRDEFLRKLFPHIRVPEKLADLCKAWLRQRIEGQRWIASDQQKPKSEFSPSDDEVSQEFNNLGEAKIDGGKYSVLGYEILYWYRSGGFKSRSRTNSENASKSWEQCNEVDKKDPKFKGFAKRCHDVGREILYRRDFKRFIKTGKISTARPPVQKPPT